MLNLFKNKIHVVVKKSKNPIIVSTESCKNCGAFLNYEYFETENMGDVKIFCNSCGFVEYKILY